MILKEEYKGKDFYQIHEEYSRKYKWRWIEANEIAINVAVGVEFDYSDLGNRALLTFIVAELLDKITTDLEKEYGHNPDQPTPDIPN